MRRATTGLDLALAGLMTVAACAEVVISGGGGTALGFGVAATLLIAFRRRIPLVTACGVTVCLIAESVFVEPPDRAVPMFVLILASFSVAAHANRRDAAFGLSFLSLAMITTGALDAGDDVASLLPGWALFVGIPGGVGVAFRKRTGDVAVMEARAAAAEVAALEAVEAERRRLARELHDVVSHAVTLISVQAEAGQAVIDSDVEGARRALAAIGAASQDAVAELHAMLALLHEPSDESTGSTSTGLADLPSLVAGVRAAGLRVELVTRGVSALPPAADHCAFRVVQEGLTNALRHERNAQVRLVIDHADADSAIRVESRGTRHQSSYGGSGRGIAGLRERVAAVGGSLEVLDHDGTYCLQAVLPR
ncbi:sensor histidine kinase [Nocardioides bizhenqiangii]|uniref:histidine kinase n=1 Tax=Nocardioides bizhenqiangii TaxID=3095076 RepID=A0ABZ0ZQ00_9ACTN|nr:MULTISPECIES: histidine kinase [unclassified Nocardioides]MDZ5619564.1 histidine kinase [Nocardioides sp. HM23]WQQ26420.1 histidine kinase [Nocardioides sp. HM61]